MALFGNAAGAASSKNLVEFRAGKMKLRGTTVTADKRKGLVYVYQSDDSLMHFCWKDRISGLLEEDLIIFPDDIEFKRISQCTTGRAYILKFKSSSRKFFFWMQEPKEEKDDEHCKKVNEVLNNPPTPGSATSASGDSAAASLAGLQPALASLGDQLGDSSLQSLLNNMDQNQLMQLLGMSGMGGGGGLGGAGGLGGFESPAASTRNKTSSSTRTRSGWTGGSDTAAAAAPKPADKPSEGESDKKDDAKPATGGNGGGAVQLSHLQSILSNMQVPAASSGGEQENVDLSSAFSTEALIPLLSDKALQSRLKPFLPTVENLPESQDELRETLQSPQFKQSLSVFSAALQSGQLGPLMQQFKVNKKAVEAAAKGDIVAFVTALQDDTTTGGNDDVEDMALD